MKICIPINNKKIDALIKNFATTQKLADITELWLDNFSSKTLKKILLEISKKIKKPILYKSFGDKKNISMILKNKKIKYIDLDIKTPTSTINFAKKVNPKVKIILSSHDFKKTPSIEKLKLLSKKMEQKNPDIYKISTFAKSKKDNFKILEILKFLDKKGKKAICICMGENGTLSRGSKEFSKNYLTYVALSNKDKTAPGQLTIKEFKNKIWD